MERRFAVCGSRLVLESCLWMLPCQDLAELGAARRGRLYGSDSNRLENMGANLGQSKRCEKNAQILCNFSPLS